MTECVYETAMPNVNHFHRVTVPLSSLLYQLLGLGSSSLDISCSTLAIVQVVDCDCSQLQECCYVTYD